MSPRASGPGRRLWWAFADDAAGALLAVAGAEAWTSSRLLLVAATAAWVGLVGDRRLVGLHLLASLATGGLVLAAATDADTLLAVAVAVLGVPLAAAAARRRWRRAWSGLRAESERDPLTGLHNRRGIERWVTGRPPGRMLVLLLDVDGLRELNNGAGHQAGDAALRAVADALAAQLRTGQVAARWGGDEFVLVAALPPGGAGSGMPARLYDAVAAGAAAAGTSVSAGVAAGRVAGLADLGRLVARADRALLAAKSAGRARLVVAGAAESGRGEHDQEGGPEHGRTEREGRLAPLAGAQRDDHADEQP